MCFSSDASFAAGAVLIPAGTYCIVSAIRKRPRYLPLAVLPLLFGVQQLSEGFVWLGLHRDDPEMVRSASLVFLFFALAFWPFWLPALTALMETQKRKRVLFFGLSLLSTFWFWALYYPLITGPDSLLATSAVHHHVDYDISRLPIYNYISKIPLRVIYFLCVALPLAFGSEGLGHIPGIVFGISAVFAAIVYSHAFVSVWCFLAALLTVYLFFRFRAMPYVDATQTALDPVSESVCPKTT
jgi:hypothetical protein